MVTGRQYVLEEKINRTLGLFRVASTVTQEVVLTRFIRRFNDEYRELTGNDYVGSNNRRYS